MYVTQVLGITQRPRLCVNPFCDPENTEYTKRRTPTEDLHLPFGSSARWTLVLLFSPAFQALLARLGVLAPPTRSATGNLGESFSRAVSAMM